MKGYFYLDWHRNRLDGGEDDPHHNTEHAGTHAVLMYHDRSKSAKGHDYLEIAFRLPAGHYSADTPLLIEEMVKRLNP